MPPDLPRRPRRIFVYLREHLGDVVNSTGSLLTLRRLFPEARIVVEVGERAIGVLEGFPAVDEIWPRPDRQGAIGKLQAIARMRRGSFDLAVILDDSNPPVLLAWLAGIPARVGIWRGRKYRLLYTAYVPYRTDQCETRTNQADLLQVLGWNGPVEPPRLTPSTADEAWANEVLAATPRPRIAIVPGASRAEKRWPAEAFARVSMGLARQGRGLVALGSSVERELAQAAAGSMALNLAGQTSPMRAAAVLARVDAVLTNDTGLMHLAGTMGTRVVAVFGPTDPVAYAPPGEGHRLLTAPSGRIEEIEPGDVLTALLEVLATGDPCASPS